LSWSIAEPAMPNLPPRLPPARGAVQNPAAANASPIRKAPESRPAMVVGRLFGAMPRGWVILLLAIAAWLVLALFALAVFGFLPKG
jgi:hypothetical protein